MKILIDARFWGLENAGLGRYTMSLISSLAKIDRKNEYAILLREKYFKSLKFPGNFKKILTEVPHYSFEEQFKLPGLIRKEKPDVVHFLHFNVPVFFRGKLVVTIHDMLMHEQKGFEATTLKHFHYLVKRMGYKLGFSRGVKMAKKIIVPSNYIKDSLKKYYHLKENKVVVIYEGVDEKIGMAGGNLAKYGLEKQNYFFYVGNAYPHKNLDKLIEAIVLLNKQRKGKVILVIAGSRDFFKKKLEKKVKKEELSGLVKILGYVEDGDLGALYRNSIAFVYPSVSEGFGLQGLEAMRAGALVLASDIPVFWEIYKDNALYFDPSNTSSMRKIMEVAVKLSKEERRKRIESGQKFVRRYSWYKLANETLKVYGRS